MKTVKHGNIKENVGGTTQLYIESGNPCWERDLELGLE